MSEQARSHILVQRIFKQRGNSLERLTGSDTIVGILLLQFDSAIQRDALMDKAESHFRFNLG